MRTIVIAHRDVTFAEQLAAELRAGGYRVIDCPGPWPPTERCIRCDTGWCPLTDGADLLIYDPRMTAVDRDGERYNLAVDSACAHPELPMLLAWAPPDVPDAGTLRALRAQAPNVHVAAHEPAGLVRQIDALLAAAPTAR